MNVRELIADLPTASIDRREALLHLRVLLRYLYGSAPYAELANGGRLSDGSDFRAWFLELIDESWKVLNFPESTKVLPLSEKSTGPSVPEQPRWKRGSL